MRGAAKRSALIGITLGALAVWIFVGPATLPGALALGGMAIGALYVATLPTH